MFDIVNILKWLKKHFGKADILMLGVLIVFFLFTRLVNLEKFPIFGDEGIYIHWAKTAWNDASWRFVSLTDGKQPLQTWGTIPLLKLFPTNALLAGRLFSVATGFIGLVGMFSFLFYLFGKRIAFLGSLLYILTPYFLFYDRMALSDSGVNAGFIWMLFFSIVFAKTLRFDIALVFGFVSGLTLLTKSSARLFLGLSFFAPLLFLEKNIRRFVPKLVNYLVLFGVTGILAMGMYNIQRLSPFLHFVEEKNKTFVMTFSEFFATPYAYVKGNFPLIPYYVVSEGGIFLAIGGIIGLLLLFKHNRKLGTYLLCWFVLPYIGIAFFSKVLYPRYLNFYASLLIVTFAFLLTKVKKTVFLYPLIVLTVFSIAYYDFTILFNQSKIPFPDIDRGQYITGITAGWGVQNIIDFAREKSKEKKVIVMAEGDFGVIGDQLEVFVNKEDNIQVKGYWPLDKQHLLESQKELKNHYVYVVFSHRQKFPSDWPLRLVKKYKKPENKSSTYFFELLPK
ncbi:glycosyltransferase family 39 protein [Candidatus Roizmanbacteria bacterium]|nr:glycosyltransferase family 39 protein [Candidatus Roizmanbacteria bacterium]